ncbi:MAG: Ig-like domain-containing protein [Elainellaceae cyanobacterium]
MFISEYIEGSSNNKAIELYNPSGSAVDLSTASYTLEFYFNGETTPRTVIALAGIVASQGSFVIADDNSAAAILAVATQIAGGIFFNGNDAVILKRDGAIVDAIGQIGVDPGAQWGSGAIATKDKTLRRVARILTGDAIATDPFDPALEWEGYAKDTFDGLGVHVTLDETPPSLHQTSPFTPTDNATDVAIDTSLTLRFDESIQRGTGALMLKRAVDGSVVESFDVATSCMISINGDRLTIDPSNDLEPGLGYYIELEAGAVQDLAGNRFAGVFNSTVWNFTTVVAAPPETEQPPASEPSDPESSDPESSDPEPSDPQPTDSNPSQPDPESAEPEPFTPEPSDPNPSDPEPSDPQPTEPVPTEPNPNDPAPTAPEPTEPELIAPELTDSDSINPEPPESNPSTSDSSDSSDSTGIESESTDSDSTDMKPAGRLHSDQPSPSDAELVSPIPSISVSGEEIRLGVARRDIPFSHTNPGVVMVGEAEADVLKGTSGSDTIRGRNGNDRLFGGQNRNGHGKDRLFGNRGDDKLWGGKGKDWLNGGHGNDVLLGGKNRDLCIGGNGGDRLLGQGGNDILVGGYGDDRLHGGRGRDMFTYASLKDGTDTILRFNAKQDLIDLRQIFAGSVFSGESPATRLNAYVDWVQVGLNTEIRVDADGSGQGQDFVTLACVKGIDASEITSQNYVIV